MENSLIVGIVTATLLVILTSIKTELIKSLVGRVTGSKYSILGIVIGIFAASLLTGALSTYFPQGEKATDSQTTSSLAPERSEFEKHVDAGLEIADYTRDFANDIQENKSNKDSIYHSTRERKWVYQIGDVVNDENLLFDIYSALNDPEDVRVYKIDKDKYFLFKEDCGDEETMRSSLDVFERGCGGSDCRVVDLVANCERKEKLLKIEDLKVKQGKEKLFLPCYECGK